jgi:hypothetical protein
MSRKNFQLCQYSVMTRMLPHIDFFKVALWVLDHCTGIANYGSHRFYHENPSPPFVIGLDGSYWRTAALSESMRAYAENATASLNYSDPLRRRFYFEFSELEDATLFKLMWC